MKIILSRKGFDSSSGKVASPIFPSGKLYSLPIPMNDYGSRRYQEIQIGNLYLGTIVSSLTRGKITGNRLAHLDPDLNISSVPRQPNWKPIFGQAGAAERHLQNWGIKEGDIFIFYGWFRRVEQVDGIYRYVKDAPDLHVIFGWLQIERRIPINNEAQIPSWASDHPHCKRTNHSSLDSIYISTDYLSLPGITIDKPGAGVFQSFNPALCLTAPGMSRSIWRLPGWFYPGEGKSSLSYHEDANRWKLDGDYVLLNSATRGQEFVLDCEEYPEAIDWVCSMLSICR